MSENNFLLPFGSFDGDRVAISIYIRLSENGEWRRYSRIEYAGVQEDPVLHLFPKVSEHGLRVTLQQLEGTPKTFEFCFYRRR